MDNKKKEKSEGEKLAEKLLSDKKNGGLRLSEEKLKKADKICEGKKSFLNTKKQSVRLLSRQWLRLKKQASSLMKRARSMTQATGSIL